jgi:hypothetical protein
VAVFVVDLAVSGFVPFGGRSKNSRRKKKIFSLEPSVPLFLKKRKKNFQYEVSPVLRTD